MPHEATKLLGASPYWTTMIRNIPLEKIHRSLAYVQDLLNRKECHPDWGRKNLIILNKLLTEKERRIEKKRQSDKSDKHIPRNIDSFILEEN